MADVSNEISILRGFFFYNFVVISQSYLSVLIFMNRNVPTLNVSKIKLNENGGKGNREKNVRGPRVN